MTADEALERAKAALRIQDVWMRDARAWMAAEFDPQFSNVERLGVQHKHVVAHATLGEVTDGDQQTPYLYRVYLELGMRLVPTDESPSADQAASDTLNPLATIEATLVAEYGTQEDPGEEALNAFATRNASYHVWPFWREYVVSQCDRMRLPRVMIPTMHLNQTAFQDTAEQS